MIQCQNCGQVNTETSNFCRFCGTKFLPSQHQNGNGYEYSPPRPYSWKTDEFQIQDNQSRKPRPVKQVEPIPNPPQFQPPRPQPLVYQQNRNLAQGYLCPRCSSQLVPRFERKISTAGWIVFAVLLVTIFPLFWIGLLIKEDVRICPVCNLRIT